VNGAQFPRWGGKCFRGANRDGLLHDCTSTFCIALLTALLLIPSAARGEVCRSRKYPELVLDVEVVRNAEAFLDEARTNYAVAISSSFRSYDKQAELYRAWLARGGKGNPAAKPGRSRHEAGFAFDLNRLADLTFIHWDRLLSAGERFGFEYLLGDFPGEGTQKFDWPHFQADPRDYGLTLSQALAKNKVPPQPIGDCVWRPDLSVAAQDYLRQITVGNAKLSRAQGTGRKPTYLDATITNHGTQIIRELELRVELHDSLGGILQVRFLHPPGLNRRTLKPAATLQVHLLFARVYDFWMDGKICVRPTYVAW
jgi:D-alanyl-D-alanine carboxypeptidase-like protein